MKRVLTIAVLGNNNLNLNSMFEDAEIISADDPLIKKSKSKYTVFLKGGFSYRDLRPLLDGAESAAADIVTFNGGCLFKTSVVKYPDKVNDVFSLQITTALNCKTIEKTSFTPFNLAEDEMDCSDDAFKKLKSTINEYTAAKTKVPIQVYSFARDLICERLVLFYKCYMLAIRMGADSKKLVEFDKDIKASDMVLYKVFENRFNHAELEKLKSKDFKISFITAGKFKRELKSK